MTDVTAQAPRPAREQGLRGQWSQRTVVRTLAAGAIAVVAVAARIYELRDVPRLTDETDEVMRGLAIARGELLPLTNVDAYIGPLWNYLLATGFVVFGPSALLPRLLTLAAGLATVAAAYWLGREIALRLGRADCADLLGFGTALLLASSSFHAIVSSRIAWSHALTPLAMTIALACLLRWERARSARYLAGAGLAYGLAVHTHPTAVAVLPGLLLWALLHWRGTLVTRAGWAAFGLLVVANLPMLIFNLGSGLASASAAAQVQAAYASGESASSGGYVGNLAALLRSLPLLLAGEIGERRGTMETLDSPLAYVVAALAATGLIVACWRRMTLPVLLIGSAVLVLPLVNGKYEPLFNGRYLAPLLPLGFALVLLGGIAIFVQIKRLDRPADMIVRRVPRGRSPSAVDSPLSRARERGSGGEGVLNLWVDLSHRVPVVAVLFVLVLAVPSLVALEGYIAATLDDGPNNRELYQAAEIVAAAQPTRPVLVDATLSGTRVSTGREGTGVLGYLLTLHADLAISRSQPEEIAEAAERGAAELVVGSPRLLTRLDKSFLIETPRGEDEARRHRRANFVVFRVLGPA